MRQKKYVNLFDWEAVRAAGGDPGPRPLTDLSLDALSVVAAETLLPRLRGGLYSDSEGDARRRRHAANDALEKAGVRPRRLVTMSETWWRAASVAGGHGALGEGECGVNAHAPPGLSGETNPSAAHSLRCWRPSAWREWTG